MKLLSFLLFFLGILQLSYGQLTFRNYYTKDNALTKDTSDAYYYRELFLTDENDKIITVMEKFVHNDKIKLFGFYNNIKDKKFIGLKQTAYPNGKIKSIEKYSEDAVMMDTAKYFHPNGKLKIAYQYLYKIEKEKTKVTDTLILIFKDSLGHTHLVNGEGYAEIYNEEIDNDHPNTIEKGNYSKHKRTGEWTGSFGDGKYTFVEQYDQGKLISGTTTDSLNNKTAYDQSNFFIQPEYPNGLEAFRQYIGRNYYYPKEAIMANVAGTIRTSFIVEKDGKLSSIKVLEDLGFNTGQEAINVLKRSKKWTPGIIRGIPVRVSYTLPIKLDLTRR